jgi:hypothetical protein
MLERGEVPIVMLRLLRLSRMFDMTGDERKGWVAEW